MVIETLGDRGLILKFSDEINQIAHLLVMKIDKLLLNSKIEGVIEWIPSYSSITLIYNPEIIKYKCLLEKLKHFDESSVDFVVEGKTVEIPVLYGGKFGPDIEFVASANKISVENVIKIHSGANYEVWMIGFMPGFPYLYGLPPIINTPRLKNPRKFVPSGSIGIAGGQTGIYPIDSPGGWQIIGRTPLKIFDVKKDPPVLFDVGDRVKFIPIDEKGYEKLCR
ncbi:MAG: 5-oxoprolinase subunit PxpB [Thermotogae bacterium]|nr:5-oxoprolinase subunit PxpB [Thermotogota bacterium]MCL5032628.1 5-oxoprolinase subunit PxpB [Thermotogota bacterium]